MSAPRKRLVRLVLASLPSDRVYRHDDGTVEVSIVTKTLSGPPVEAWSDLPSLTDVELLGLLPPDERREHEARLNGEASS